MEIFVVAAALLAGGAAVLGALAWRRRGRATAPARLDAAAALAAQPARDLDALQPDDVLLHDGRDLIVVGAARLADRELAWQECRLDDEGAEHWLLVRVDDPDHLVLGRAVPDLALGTEPPESLEHAGKIFELERCGQAGGHALGDLGAGWPVIEVRYWDYRRPGADRVWLRRVGERLSTYAGQRVPRHLVTMLPGS